jgi:hypothetical protein
MKAIAIVDMDIQDPEGYSKYLPLVWPMNGKAGASAAGQTSAKTIIGARGYE